MKASELVARLQTLIGKHGDLEVELGDRGGMSDPLATAQHIEETYRSPPACNRSLFILLTEGAETA